MSKIKPQDLGAALEETLTVYHQNVVEEIDRAGDTAMQALVKRTRATAPKGARGDFKRHIAGKRLEKTTRRSTYVWYVKAPDYRLTHLLVKGHATKDGGRTEADPFLANALGEVLPQYEEAVKEAIRNAK